jgi:hypothetical protein
MKKAIAICLTFLVLTSCISTRSTIRNIDDNIPMPAINEALGSFIITKMAKDKKYAYNEDYPVNVGFTTVDEGLINQVRYLNTLAGPNGEKITYTQKDACCPYPSKKADTGAGYLDTFEITWQGQTKPVILYMNKFEKGELMIPLGLSIRK